MNTVTLSLKDYNDLKLFEKAIHERRMIGVYYKTGLSTYFMETSESLIEDLNMKLSQVHNENHKLKKEIMEMKKENKKWWKW